MVVKAPKEPKPPKAPKEPKPPKEPKTPKAPKVIKPKTSLAASRKKRKRRGYASDDSSDISEFDCDDSGSYMSKSWGTTKRTRTREATAATATPDGAPGSSSGAAAATTTATGAEEEEEEYYEEEEEVDALNPLPGFIDPISLEVVEKPAISKYGHVMGYDSWIRCLLQDGTAKNICPFSKKPLTKRDLTILTFENFDEFRDKIVNM